MTGPRLSLILWARAARQIEEANYRVASERGEVQIRALEERLSA